MKQAGKPEFEGDLKRMKRKSFVDTWHGYGR